MNLTFVSCMATGVACLALLAAAPSTVFAGELAQSTPDKPHAAYWVFLNKGAARSKVTGMTKEERAKMQADHVGNLGTLYKQGRAFTAGPLGDDGFIRGIVVLNVGTPEEVKDCFKPDPFVQNDILAVEAYRWVVDTTKFHKAIEPFKMATHTLGVVKRGKNFQPLKEPLTSGTMIQALPCLKAMAESGELAVSGPLADAGDLVGILLFPSSDRAKIQDTLAQDPAVKDGVVLVELHPQFMGAGVLQVPGGN